MEEFLNMAVNNGVSIFVCVAFIWFLNNYFSKMNDTLNELNKVLTTLVTSMQEVQNKVNTIDDKIDKITNKETI